MTSRFDDVALRAPVDPALARAEGRELVRHEGGRSGEAAAGGWIVFQSAVLVVGAGALAALCVLMVQLMFGAPGADATTVVIAGLMVVPLAVMRIRGVVRGRRASEVGWYRLRRFTEANGMSYTAVEKDPVRPAALFRVGSLRVAGDLVTGTAHRPFEVANYAYSTWTGSTRMPHTACYVMFTVRTALPPMTLVTAARDVPSCAWGVPPSHRPLVMGGSFDVHFQVLCAPQDDDAVRRLLTPAVQETLVELAGNCDVEIVDGRVFFIARWALPNTAPAFWEWIEDLAALVDEQLDRQGGSAVPGRRVADEARRSRRATLFARTRLRGIAVVGCLIPLLFGVVAAVLTSAIMR
ncbi:hypothetical protein OOK41_19690 [Micromonospora sp. NBC_01655]|uniref:hypothetical protein n=1 Tax=Micromonospora sp. NBC_01655 TaxID=2975983 RepID=UPI002250906E|nr:hypothetical protein [Micromonospora sp. NBC_01655]MCX4472499.1 hypothetical protein [Micromonospora sp. NBC_01655]